MSKRPDIKEGDWIKVGSCNCVVSIVRDLDHPFGDGEVVLNPKKPANVDVKWSGTEWVFVDPDNFGGYAEKYPRLNSLISIFRSKESPK